MFGGLSAIGIEEVSHESTTDDSSVILGAPAFEMQWRPEFDVTIAYNPRSVLVPVARIEGLTWTMLAPGSTAGGTFLAGQGAAVTLDGRYDAVLAGSRALFINLGGNANAMSAGSRAGQWMLLEQAIRETRTPSARDEQCCCIRWAAKCSRSISPAVASSSTSIARRHPSCRRVRERNGMKPIIAGGAEAWVVAEELAREKVPVLLDALANLPNTSTTSARGSTTQRC